MKTLTINLDNGDKLMLLKYTEWKGMSIQQRYESIKPLLDEMYSGEWATKPERYHILGTYDTQSGEIDFKPKEEWVKSVVWIASVFEHRYFHHTEFAYTAISKENSFLSLLRSSTEKAGITETKFVIILIAK